MSNRRLSLAAPAERDLQAILQYSEQTWGKGQRDSYAAKFEAAFERLKQFPNIGPVRDDIRPGVRAHLVEQHLVIYRVESDSIVVLAIVHTRMGAARITDM